MKRANFTEVKRTVKLLTVNKLPVGILCFSRKQPFPLFFIQPVMVTGIAGGQGLFYLSRRRMGTPLALILCRFVIVIKPQLLGVFTISCVTSKAFLSVSSASTTPVGLLRNGFTPPQDQLASHVLLCAAWTTVALCFVSHVQRISQRWLLNHFWNVSLASWFWVSSIRSSWEGPSGLWSVRERQRERVYDVFLPAVCSFS